MMHFRNVTIKMAATRRRKSKWDVPSTANDSTSNANLSATDAAKERAAKLNAMLAAQGKLAKGTPPPAMGHPSPAAKVTVAPSLSFNNGNKNLVQDLVTAEVEVNDSPARTFLCRGTTQDEINRYSGAAVSTRGKFMSEQEKKEAEGTGVKPLYLCIQGLTQEKVDLAVKRIREIMIGADMNSISQSHPGVPQPQRMPVPPPMPTPAFNQPLAIFDRQPLPPGMHYVQDKVFVGLENSLSEFNVNEKLQGLGGSYFQHISTQTGAKVQLRGRGSGFIEPTSGKEAFETLYIYISHSKVDGLAAAKKLVENLIQTVHTEYKAFEQTRRSHYGYSPYMNVGNSPGQPPSGYQPLPYGYPRPPPPGNGYPQPAQPPQPPPAPGYMYNRPPHAPPHQPPPPPLHPGVPHPLPPHYGPPPPPVAGYPNQPPPSMGPPPPTAPRGPAPYHGYPPGPHHQGVPPPGLPPAGPHHEGPVQPPPPALHLGPPLATGHQFQDQGSSTSYQDHFQGETMQLPQTHDPPRRKFKEKIPFKASSMQDHIPGGPIHQESFILNPTLGQAVQFETERRPPRNMPPPPAPLLVKFRPKEREFAAPLPLNDAMPPPLASVRSRVPGKREAATFSQPAAVTKKQKTDDIVAVNSSAIASLVAYGEGDSSDEEGYASPEDRLDVPQTRDSGETRQGTRLPFWAVRR